MIFVLFISTRTRVLVILFLMLSTNSDLNSTFAESLEISIGVIARTREFGN
jgi:hypothetical protein